MADMKDDAPPILLLPCPTCNRTFKSESLTKHTKVCEKASSKKRKVFDSTKQRVQGTDLAEYLPGILRSKTIDQSPPRKCQSRWKEKHVALMNTIRAARGMGDSQNVPLIQNTNNEECPHCNRHFGFKSFERHIEWCKEQKFRIRKPPSSSQAKERLEARIKYRAPLSKSMRSVTRDKYSPHSRGGDTLAKVESTTNVPLIMPIIRSKEGQKFSCDNPVTRKPVTPRIPAIEPLLDMCAVVRGPAKSTPAVQKSPIVQKNPIARKSSSSQNCRSTLRPGTQPASSPLKAKKNVSSVELLPAKDLLVNKKSPIKPKDNR